MRYSYVFVTSAMTLAGLTAALPVARESFLEARFSDSDALYELDARAFDDDLELSARGNVFSKGSGGDKERKNGNPPKYNVAKKDPPPHYAPSPHFPPHLDSFRTEPDYSHNHKTPTGHNHHRRADFDELEARGNTFSKGSGGDKERKNGNPPKYKTAKKDPPPHYAPSPHFPPHLDSFRTEADYSHNHKTPTGHNHHRRADFDELAARGNTFSKGSGGGGDKEGKNGKPPKYKTAKNDPPPHYVPSHEHPPRLPSFQRETSFSGNHKTPTGHNRRSFYDLD